MRIAAYEVTDDERGIMEAAAAERGAELAAFEGILSSATLPLAGGADAVTTLGRSRLDAALLEKLAGMGVRYVSTRTMGVDHIDVSAAAGLGIRVAHAAYPPESVADFTVMLMLMVLRNSKPAMWRQQVNDYSLQGLMGRSMNSRTVGILGAGNIGSAVARCLSGFGCRILAYSRSRRNDLSGIAEYVGLDELLEESDIITVHVPYTPATRGMINRELIARMKDGVILVNTARGDLMDIAALTEGIENEKIGGLAMDVFANERGIYHADRKTDIIKNKDMAYLRQFPNVVFTPHMAFYTMESIASMAKCGVQALCDMAEGRETRMEIH